MGNRESELDPLPHSFAVARHATVSGLRHVHLLDCLPRHFIGYPLAQALPPQQGRDQSKTRDAFRKRIELGAVANVPVERFGIVRSSTQDLDVAARWPDQSRQQIHQRRLARAVRSNEARDAWTYSQVDFIDAQHLAVKLRNVCKDNPVRFGRHRTTSYARIFRFSRRRLTTQTEPTITQAVHAGIGSVRNPIGLRALAARAYPSASLMKKSEFQTVPITTMAFKRLPHPIRMISLAACPNPVGKKSRANNIPAAAGRHRSQADEASATSEMSVTHTIEPIRIANARWMLSINHCDPARADFNR